MVTGFPNPGGLVSGIHDLQGAVTLFGMLFAAMAEAEREFSASWP
ncbi:hypothetical protein ACFXJO_12925 [Streptomyces lavendulae]